jgi:hypothetical protein
MMITPLGSQVTGTHLLLELADATERKSIPHESESIAPTDGRLVIL